MTPDPADPRTRLNNFCQHLKLTLTFGLEETGPQNQPEWKSVAYINDVEYGRGSGSTKGDAKKVAAEAALTQMKKQYPGYHF
ncbi:hypothetical protein CVT26_014932 [Gymnopilus dilepis]|uniref:DRBM domain-containing protein n=1 Tax=Gymnopilus dilepis TaxID=231916 RepID=A0A409XWY6_9AGAR|nr:hypothetical protein CVT26_014932 [Gymnopilus dilepis]